MVRGHADMCAADVATDLIESGTAPATTTQSDQSAFSCPGLSVSVADERHRADAVFCQIRHRLRVISAKSLPRNAAKVAGGAPHSAMRADIAVNHSWLEADESDSAITEKPAPASSVRVCSGVARWLVDESRAHGTGKCTCPPAPWRTS